MQQRKLRICAFKNADNLSQNDVFLRKDENYISVIMENDISDQYEDKPLDPQTKLSMQFYAKDILNNCSFILTEKNKEENSQNKNKQSSLNFARKTMLPSEFHLNFDPSSLKIKTIKRHAAYSILNDIQQRTKINLLKKDTQSIHSINGSLSPKNDLLKTKLISRLRESSQSSRVSDPIKKQNSVYIKPLQNVLLKQSLRMQEKNKDQMQKRISQHSNLESQINASRTAILKLVIQQQQKKQTF